MAMKKITGALKSSPNLFQLIKGAVANNQLQTIQGVESFSDFETGLSSIQGTESMALQKSLKGIGRNAMDAFVGSLGRDISQYKSMDSNLVEAANLLSGIQGTEGFSMQNFKGSETDIKAANLTLNAQSHLQTPGAEALFSTITVRYEDEGVELVVRAAGLGSYAYGNTAWQSASELRPIFGLLRTGEMFKDEVLALYPVYPAAADSTRAFFVPAATIAPTDAVYSEHDAYGRDNHLTQMLAVPVIIPNLLGLSQAPGQRPWTATDEIESNSISARRVLVSATIDGVASSFFINTASMSNNTFAPGSNIQSSDDRQLNLAIRRLPGFSVEDKDGAKVGETLFVDFKTAGYEPLLDVFLSGNYQRQNNELRLTAGQVTVAALREISSGEVISIGRATAPQIALINSLTAGSVSGAKLTYNVSNTSRGNFGYRIEVFAARKHLSVRRRSPISVKYPISADDVNQNSLDFAIQQMSVAINNQCSKIAFEEANAHLKYITSINGAPVVGNNQGSNVLPGQHFVSATAINRSFKLADAVSTVDSSGLFEAISSTVTNELLDIICALNTKSGLAAIAEYGAADVPTWTVVVHQNLSRFVFRQGDARTFGPKVMPDVIETNFDSQIGQILIVPKNTSTNDSINPLGGVGVNVSKENILVQGNVTRDQQDFGVVMTLPTFKHWALNPVIGSLVIEDAAEFLNNEGLFSKLATQRVTVNGVVNTNDTTPPAGP